MPSITILIHKQVFDKYEAEDLLSSLKDKFTDAKNDNKIKITAQYQDSLE